MSKRSFKLYDKLVSWQFLEDALPKLMTYHCPRCATKILVSLQHDSEGSLYHANEPDVAAHLTRLSKKYHAPSRFVQKQCSRGHPAELIFVFGETQPARYVLAQAASVKPTLRAKESVVIFIVLVIVLSFFGAITVGAYSTYRNYHNIKSNGQLTTAMITNKETSDIPKSPISYRLGYAYRINDSDYTDTKRVDEKTFMSNSVGDSVDIFVAHDNPKKTEVKGNTNYKSSVLATVFITTSTVLLAFILWLKTKKTDKK